MGQTRVAARSVEGCPGQDDIQGANTASSIPSVPGERGWLFGEVPPQTGKCQGRQWKFQS